MFIDFLSQVVVVDRLAMQQDNSETEVRGPPASKAFDADGNCTKVGLSYTCILCLIY